jgi:hypothetical protein
VNRNVDSIIQIIARLQISWCSSARLQFFLVGEVKLAPKVHAALLMLQIGTAAGTSCLCLDSRDGSITVVSQSCCTLQFKPCKK